MADEKTVETSTKKEVKRDAYGCRIMTKSEFWIRFAIWVGFALIAPIIYIVVAYGLFTQHEAGASLSGWGVIAVVFFGISLMFIVSQAKKGLRYGSFVRQCVDGALALIPFLCAILIVHSIKDNIDSFEPFLVFTFICEAIAIPVNPMRRWAEQNNLERADNFVVSTIKKALGKDEEKK